MRAVLRRFVLLLTVVATSSGAQRPSSLPTQLTDKQFWDLFTSASEEGGSFPSENFISNELTYQHVIPSLQSTVRAGDVYLGVGPEQNFTYIANLKPRLAVIFDIRRQNAMAHLMYKALFELSPTRADFLSRLFSRPLPASLKQTATPAELFAALDSVQVNDSVFNANEQAIFDRLAKAHGFAIDSVDRRSMRHVYVTFFEAGTGINYGFRPGFRGGYSAYPTLGQLQSLTNAAGENMAFLADEGRYQTIRAMHLKNLIVPVVGNFAGPKAIREVGRWLHEHNANVSAFYLSNVEQYLFRQPGDVEHFYQNVAALPTDSTSMFIRSVPPSGPFGGGTSLMNFGSSTSANSYSVQVVDSGGVSIIAVTKDSAGRRVTLRTVDSSATRPRGPLPVFRALQAKDDSIARARLGITAPSGINGLRPSYTVTNVMTGGSLISGTASIAKTLDLFVSGSLDAYDRVIAMTKTDGWK